MGLKSLQYHILSLNQNVSTGFKFCLLLHTQQHNESFTVNCRPNLKHYEVSRDLNSEKLSLVNKFGTKIWVGCKYALVELAQGYPMLHMIN